MHPSLIHLITVVCTLFTTAAVHAGEPPADAPAATRLAKLEGPSGVAAAFSKDGKAILTAGGVELRVWSAETYQPLFEPIKHDEALTMAAFRDDGMKVLTVAGNNAYLRDAATGKPLVTLKHGAKIRSACFSPGGKKVITGGDDHFARVWDAAAGKELLARKHPAAVFWVQVAADGKTVLTEARLHPNEKAEREESAEFPEWFLVSGAAYVWDIGTGLNLIDPYKAQAARTARSRDQPWLRPASLSADGEMMITSDESSGLIIWDTRNGKDSTVKTNEANQFGPDLEELVSQVVFSPDSKTLLAVAGTKSWLWNRSTGLSARLVNKPHWGWDAEAGIFSPDGRHILLSRFGGVGLLAVDAHEVVIEGRRNDDNKLPAVAFSPDGRRFAVGFASDGYTAVWRINPAAEPAK